MGACPGPRGRPTAPSQVRPHEGDSERRKGHPDPDHGQHAASPGRRRLGSRLAREKVELGQQLAGGARAVLSFYKRLPGGSDYPADAPVFISGEGSPSPLLVSAVQARIGHPIQALPAPPRISPEIRYGPYMACLGLIMRRR